MRCALPKGRNLEPVLEALEASGLELDDLDRGRLRQSLPGVPGEILLLKDWDVPLYVEQGVADWGFVGSDVLEELGSELLVPARIAKGRSRISLIGKSAVLPPAGGQLRIASKYPNWTRRLLGNRAWGLDVFRLSGSVELGPLLELADVAVDIVQTGRTLREHDLVEIEPLADVAACLVVSRSAYHRYRDWLNERMRAMESNGVVL